MPKLYFQGHGSYRLTADDGRVIYIDPYKGDGYDLPADIIFVTHQHGDHNQVKRCAQKQDCRIISNKEALAGGKYCSFNIDGIMAEAVMAENSYHDPKECVGFIITIDGVKIYASGDTSRTKQMETFSPLKIDYALFPCDGYYNMGPEEAAECAKLINAKHNILIHPRSGESIREKAEGWEAPNKLIIEPGQEIDL